MVALDNSSRFGALFWDLSLSWRKTCSVVDILLNCSNVSPMKPEYHIILLVATAFSECIVPLVSFDSHQVAS